MKKVFLILFLLVVTLSAQQRFMVNNSTTTGSVDTVVFNRPFWGFQVTNFGSDTDTVYIWTSLTSTANYYKYPLLGGYSMYFPSSAPTQYLFIQGSRAGISRLIVVFY